MAPAAQVAVVGMNALRRDLRRLSEDVSGPLFEALKKAGRAAAEPVAAATRAALPHVTGTLAGDVRVFASRTGAGVRVGRAAVRYAGPVEFGGWPPGRDFVRDGRYLFPAARGLAEASARAYSDELERVFSRSSVWTNATANVEAIRD